MSYLSIFSSEGFADTLAGETDIIIAKLDNQNKLVWVKQIGANSGLGPDLSFSDSCTGIALDNDNNVYCAGYTYGGFAEANAFTSGVRSDAILMKLDGNNGNILWAKQWGATTMSPAGNSTALNDGFNGIVFHKGKLYVTGESSSSFMETAGNYDVIALRFDLDGNIEWTTQVGTVSKPGGWNVSGREYCGNPVVDQNDFLYCVGQTNGNLIETNAGSYDIFLMKFNTTNGSLVAGKHIGATTAGLMGWDASREDSCSKLFLDYNGDLVCSGYTVDSSSNTHSLMMKFDSNLNPLWVKQIVLVPVDGKIPLTESISDIAFDTDSNIYFVGGMITGFTPPMDFQGDTIYGKLDPSGNVLWQQNSGSWGIAYEAILASNIFIDGDEIKFFGATSDGLFDENGGSVDIFSILIDKNGEAIRR